MQILDWTPLEQEHQIKIQRKHESQTPQKAIKKLQWLQTCTDNDCTEAATKYCNYNAIEAW